MSSTTQILFHSPALKSLKREQLMKLCKRHGLKANGKNAELIERLRQKASELPAEAIEWRDSDEDEIDPLMDDSLLDEQLPRPSEQWEIVMDDIEEVDEAGSSNILSSVRSVRTIPAPGEFGTATSKTSVTSNLKAAIANSFGLKRAGLAQHDPRDIGTTRSLPVLPSQSDLALDDEPPVEPIPGAPSRPGKAAPANARLSAGTSGGVTTTIRLVSSAPKSVTDTPPRLAPYSTTLELDMGTPSAAKNVWPPTPSATFDSGRLYPTIPPEDLTPAYASTLKKNSTPSIATPARATPFKSTPGKAVSAKGTPQETPFKKDMPSNDVQDIFSPAKPAPPASANKLTVPVKPQSRLSVPQNDPFLFGSPLPRHSVSNTQFNTAAHDVLQEMNRRLAEVGVPKIEKTVLESAGKAPLPAPAPRQDKPAADRFAKTHEKVFDKMDSIVNHYAARRPAPSAPAPQLGQKRKSDAVAPARAGPAAKKQSNVAQARVFSGAGRKKLAVPGGFGDEPDEEDEEPQDVGDRRSSKRIRVEEAEDVHKGRRVSLLPNDGKTPAERAMDEKKRQREREVLQKKIETRRRSSRGVAGRAPVTKPKPSRFGLLGVAKSIVGKVWNMGSGASKPAPAAPAKPPAQPRSTSAEKGSVAQKATASSLAKTVAAPAAELKVPARTATTSGSARSRSPIPSFDQPAPDAAGASRTAPLNVRKASNPMPAVGIGASSLGARTRTTTGPSHPSTLGLKPPADPPIPIIRTPSSTSETPGTRSANPVRKRTVSTLMAPTASSLAKRASATPSAAGPSRATLHSNAPGGEGTLQQITNSSKTPRALPARPTARVFSSPLDVPSSPIMKYLPVDAMQDIELGSGGAHLKRPPAAAAASAAATDGAADADADAVDGENGAPAVPPKPSSLIARKPRISRTKVIARLGQQRSVSGGVRAGSSSGSGAGPAAGRTRSSVGATPRRSMGVVKNQRGPSGAGADLLLKKRVRQSEIARRSSKIGAAATVRPKARDSGAAMDVDA